MIIFNFFLNFKIELNFKNCTIDIEDNKKEENNQNNSTIININNTINLDNINTKDKNIHINILTSNGTNTNKTHNFLNFQNNDHNNNVFKDILYKLYQNIDVFKYCIDIIKNEGISVLFDGMSSSVMGAIVQNGIYFCAVKIFSYLLKRFDITINSNILRSMVINLLSAICTAFVTNPIWVLNIRMAKKSKEVL